MKRTLPRYSGKNIKLAMETQGRRNDWLAQRVGVPAYTVTRWMSGESLLSREDATSVARELGIPFILLFESHYWDDDASHEERSAAVSA